MKTTRNKFFSACKSSNQSANKNFIEKCSLTYSDCNVALKTERNGVGNHLNQKYFIENFFDFLSESVVIII